MIKDDSFDVDPVDIIKNVNVGGTAE